MTPATALALAAMLLGGVGDLVYKQGMRAGLSPHRFLMVQTWVFVPTVVVYGVLSRSLGAQPAALWGCVAGLFVFAGLYNFARSLQTGLVSINAPIFRLSFVVTVLLAVLVLGEVLTPGKLAGLAGAAAAVWLLVGVPAGARTQPRPSLASLARVITATASIGVANFVYKIGLGAGASSSSLLVAQALFVSSVALVLVKVTDGRVVVPPRAWRYAGTAGLVLALSFIGLTEGLARGPASVVVPIAQMGFVVTALLGVLVLREPFGRRRALGLGAAVGAILLLASG